LRISWLKSTTYPLRLPTWTSPRNPQTSPHSRHLSVTLPPIFRHPLRPFSPPQCPAIPQQATPSSCGSRPAPSSNTNLARQEKGKERAPPAPPPPQPNRVWPSPAADPDLPRYDMSTSPPTLYCNPEVFAKKYPHTWEAEEFTKGKYPPGPLGPRSSGPRLAIPHHHVPQDHPHRRSSCRTPC